MTLEPVSLVASLPGAVPVLLLALGAYFVMKRLASPAAAASA